MATVKSFEELNVWQDARELAQLIHASILKMPFKYDFELRSQISRASGSVCDNIAEGFERGGNKELIYFLAIAKGSAGEVRSQLYRAFDRNYLTREEFEDLKAKAISISSKIAHLIEYLKKSSFKGSRYLSSSTPTTKGL